MGKSDIRTSRLVEIKLEIENNGGLRSVLCEDDNEYFLSLDGCYTIEQMRKFVRLFEEYMEVLYN